MLTPFDGSTGAALTSATVNVFQPGTVTPVAGTLFDKNGGTLANPLTSDATTGLVDFYMNVSQEVDLQVAKTGFTTRTYSNIPVLDDATWDLSGLLTTTGDIAFASAANTPARLAVGATGTFLTNSGTGVPSWSNTIAAGGLTVTAGNVGIGGVPLSTLSLLGTGIGGTAFPASAGATFANTAGLLYIQDAGAGVNNGGVIAFGASQGWFAAIKGFLINGASNTVGDLAFATRNATTDVSPTERMRIASGGLVTINNGLSVTAGAAATVGVRVTTGTTASIQCDTGILVAGSPVAQANYLGLTAVTVAAGGGAAATLGTVGATGPASATMNSWLKIFNGTTTAFIPIWV